MPDSRVEMLPTITDLDVVGNVIACFLPRSVGRTTRVPPSLLLRREYERPGGDSLVRVPSRPGALTNTHRTDELDSMPPRDHHVIASRGTPAAG